MKKSIFIIAGETSGDHHGALLMQNMMQLDHEISFLGIGGPKMESKGLRSLVSIQQMAVMGFIEVIRHIRFFRTVERTVLSAIGECRPDRIILIDYPGFNLRMAQKLHNRFKIPITYYISPQIWAWKPGRIEIIRKCVQQMLVIFPFEKQWYHDQGIEVEFVGYPLLDEWKSTPRSELCARLGISPDLPVLTLYPGSRKNEVRRHLPLLLKSARILKNHLPGLQILIGAAPGFFEFAPASATIPDDVSVEIRRPRLALEAADAAIVASGTSTLEAAIFGTPLVVMYKMNPLSWWITRFLVNVPFAGMVNIIAGEAVAPEFLQNNANATAISNAALQFYTDGIYTNAVKDKLKRVKDSFGPMGASHRAAKAILSVMGNPTP